MGLIFLPVFGLGSIVLTLPYAILIRLMPKEHGPVYGMFSMMRGKLTSLSRHCRGGYRRSGAQVVGGGSPSSG